MRCAGRRLAGDPRRLILKQTAQHPRSLFVDFQALRQQIGGRLVVGRFNHREQLSRRARRRFLRINQMTDHIGRLGHARHLLDRRQLGELGEGSRRRMAERADALGDDVERVPLLGVLPHEHQVQAVELRAGDVPVEVVRQYVSARYVRMDMAKMEGKYSVI